MDNMKIEVRLKRCCLDGVREIFKSDVSKNLKTLIAVVVNMWQCKCWNNTFGISWTLVVAVIPDLCLTFILQDVVIIGEQQGALVFCQIKDFMQRTLPFNFRRQTWQSPNVFASLHWCALLGSAEAPAFRFHTAPSTVHECAMRKQGWKGRHKQISVEQAASEKNGCFCCHAKHCF